MSTWRMPLRSSERMANGVSIRHLMTSERIKKEAGLTYGKNYGKSDAESCRNMHEFAIVCLSGQFLIFGVFTVVL